MERRFCQRVWNAQALGQSPLLSLFARHVTRSHGTLQWGLCSGRTSFAPPAAFFECSKGVGGAHTAHHPMAGDAVVISGNTLEKWCEVRVERNLHFTRCDDDE